MNLIYTIAYGSDAWHQAVLLAQSLRQIGCYGDDLVVFSDTNAEMAGARVVYRKELQALFDSKLAKSFIGMSLDVSAYEKVMFLDSDIVAWSPISDLFKFDGLAAGIDGLWESEVRRQLGLQEDIANYNTGAIVAPSGMWNNLCAEWLDYTNGVISVIRSYQREGLKPTRLMRLIDQPAFNMMVQKTQRPVTAFPDGWHCLLNSTTDVTAQCRLLHCILTNKHAIMKLLFQLRLNHA